MQMQNQQKVNRKLKKSHILLIGSLLVFIGFIIISFEYFQKMKGDIFSDMEIQMNGVPLVNDDDNIDDTNVPITNNLPDDKEGKIRHYKLIQDVAERVCKEKGSIVCRELLEKKAEEKESYVPDDRTSEYYKTRPCLGMVEEMAKITEEILKGRL